MNSSRVIPLTARILLLSLGLLVANSSASGSVISAYAYSNASQPSDGIHDLSNKITNTGMIDNVYLIAVDVDSVGGVHVKNEEQNRFYPYFWTGKSKPTFTANINVDANLDWTVHNPTQNLIQQLGQNNWKQDFDGDVHVDAEFVMDVTTMPSNCAPQLPPPLPPLPRRLSTPVSSSPSGLDLRLLVFSPYPFHQ